MKLATMVWKRKVSARTDDKAIARAVLINTRERPYPARLMRSNFLPLEAEWLVSVGERRSVSNKEVEAACLSHPSGFPVFGAQD